MLSIGIFCALKMRSFPKDHGELPDDNKCHHLPSSTGATAVYISTPAA